MCSIGIGIIITITTRCTFLYVIENYAINFYIGLFKTINRNFKFFNLRFSMTGNQ